MMSEIPSQCVNCGKFAKEISRKKINKITHIIYQCNYCKTHTLSSINYYLDVSGEMLPNIRKREIKPNDKLWNKYYEGDGK
jgi:uncharacterized Zn finger protein